MEENILRDFENFEENPEKKLLVSRGSNTFYIKKNGKRFIAKQLIKSVSNITLGEDAKIMVKYDYYNIFNGEKITSLTTIATIHDERTKYSDEECLIIHLADMLNLKGDKKLYLTLDAVNRITGNGEKDKVYKKVRYE